jgi:hypothetical protein
VSSTNNVDLYAYGRVIAAFVAGNLFATGMVWAPGKDFRIDHPLDPAGKYLNHASVESSQLKTFYDGKIELDAADVMSRRIPAANERGGGSGSAPQQPQQAAARSEDR